MTTFKKLFMGIILMIGLNPGMHALAEDWPPRNVKIIVPYSAGGATDAIARYLSTKMEEKVQSSVTVHNVTGGGTIIGMRQVATSKADGGNMLFTGSSSFTVMKHVMASFAMDPEAELKPITFVNTLPHWIVINADRKENTFAEFVDYIRANPGEANISVNQLGGAAHLALANWLQVNSLDATIVPYRGSSAAMVDLIGGSTTAHVDVVGSSMSFVKSGQARALAVLQEQPVDAVPDVAVSSSANDGGLLVSARHVLAVPTETSDNITDKIYNIIQEIADTSEFETFIQNLGFEVSTPNPSDSQQILANESAQYKELVQKTGITID